MDQVTDQVSPKKQTNLKDQTKSDTETTLDLGVSAPVDTPDLGVILPLPETEDPSEKLSIESDKKDDDSSDDAEKDKFGNIIGDSPILHEFVEQIEDLAEGENIETKEKEIIIGNPEIIVDSENIITLSPSTE